MGTKKLSCDGEGSGGGIWRSDGRGRDDGKGSDGRRDGDGSEDALVLWFDFRRFER